MKNHQQLYKEAEKILEDLAHNLKDMQKEESAVFCKDQRKILKLFNYSHWDEYMRWINEKLDESGETIKEDALSEIIEEEPENEESLDDSRIEFQESQSQLLAIQNAKLRRENHHIQQKIQSLRKKLLLSFQ